MPHSIVLAKEYECCRCEYKWINRKNGEERPQPKYCPYCKSNLWDTERVYATTYEEQLEKRQDRLRLNELEEWKYRNPIGYYKLMYGELEAYKLSHEKPSKNK